MSIRAARAFDQRGRIATARTVQEVAHDGGSTGPLEAVVIIPTFVNDMTIGTLYGIWISPTAGDPFERIADVQVVPP
jgi:hypothetical protein